jgi:carbamoyltransferase
VVIEDAAHRYFDGAYLSPHMTFVMKTRPEWRAAIPAVVHCDGTARVQTVSQSDNLDLYELLRAFERRSGLPILLNTSFNGRDMPIVETPAEAMAFFQNSALHALVLEDVLVTKRDAPDLPSHVGARDFAKVGHES